MRRIKSFIIAQGILALLKDADKKKIIPELAAKVDEISDKNLSGRSEKVQSSVVELVLLPLSKELLKETPGEYARLLTHAIANEVYGAEEKTPERGNGGNFRPE